MDRHAGASLTLYGRDGRRKYLTPSERRRLIATAETWPRAEVGTLCLTIAHTGCRISEALALTCGSIEQEECFVVFRSLKKRKKIVFRGVPVPLTYIERMHRTHLLQTADPAARLWRLSRTQAWVLIKQVMTAAAIVPGPHATPKGLRHGFGIHAVRSTVPLNLVRRWLGHASLATTAIYTEAIGDEERELASRMWS